MAGRATEAVVIAAAAAVITVVLAAPTLQAPSERLFGMAIVGRHHDPFTVMEQFSRPISLGVYSQPVTDVAGAWLARISGPVAAYNWLVLLSFPLSAAAAYLLARHLSLSRAGATVAAIAFAFSPFHLAHAAYHPHIAQTQWIALYLLALFRCLDDASPARVMFLAGAAAAVTLSNFYGGLIAAAITPVAVAAYWIESHPRAIGPLLTTLGTLGLIAAAGMAYVFYAAPSVLANPAAYAFDRADLIRYSATWWSYLIPPVEHPLLGAAARRFWETVGVREGLLEQQVFLGVGVLALASIAVVRRTAGDAIARSSHVWMLVIVAATAVVCSLSAPFYFVAPMFRSYARFGVVVQFMAAILAGIGIEYLLRTRTRLAWIACLALVILAAAEYAVVPSALSRDVLPTTAHRWITRQPAIVRAFDCLPITPESESVQWLTDSRVTLASATSDCTEPNLPEKLAATGFTHLLVRRDTPDGRWFTARARLEGLGSAVTFEDAQVFAVTSRTPAIYTSTMVGFFPREHDSERSWQWMGSDAAWTIVNTTARPITATASIEISAFAHPRRLQVRLDGREIQPVILMIDPARRTYTIGPMTVPLGQHLLVFQPIGDPTVATDVIDNGDRRALSLAFGAWRWTAQEERP